MAHAANCNGEFLPESQIGVHQRLVVQPAENTTRAESAAPSTLTHIRSDSPGAIVAELGFNAPKNPQRRQVDRSTDLYCTPPAGMRQTQLFGALPEEYRDDSRFAKLDTMIEAGGKQTRTAASERHQNKDTSPVPKQVRKEIAEFAHKLRHKFGSLFASDPACRKRAGQFLIALLPPKPRRRGRPGIPSVSLAIRLLRKFRRQYPSEPAAAFWNRIYPLAIPNYNAMTEHEQKHARQVLRERVRWRLRYWKRRGHRN